MVKLLRLIQKQQEKVQSLGHLLQLLKRRKLRK